MCCTNLSGKYKNKLKERRKKSERERKGKKRTINKLVREKKGGSEFINIYIYNVFIRKREERENREDERRHGKKRVTITEHSKLAHVT